MIKDNRYPQNPMVRHEFGMEVSETCATVNARVLPPPMVFRQRSYISVFVPLQFSSHFTPRLLIDWFFTYVAEVSGWGGSRCGPVEYD